MAGPISAIGMTAVIVSRPGLGTIKPTLLTIGYLRSRGIRLAGVVMNSEQDRDNREAIEKFGEVSVLAVIPLLEPLSFESISHVSDRLGLKFDERPRAA